MTRHHSSRIAEAAAARCARMAEEERTYQRSAQYEIDRAADAERRRLADIKAGHLPDCSLTKYAKGCRHA